MATPDVMFLHGLESGPMGRKHRALATAGWHVVAPDCTGISDIDVRVERTLAALAELERPVVVVGSSFGGLTAVMAWRALEGDPAGGRVTAMLLLAPALHLGHVDTVTTVHPRTHLVHGWGDDVVPCEASIAAARRWACPLTLVPDEHRLLHSEAMWLHILARLAPGGPTARLGSGPQPR